MNDERWSDVFLAALCLAIGGGAFSALNGSVTGGIVGGVAVYLYHRLQSRRS